ncbi:MAG: hypothetical protein KKB20_23035, partial [Proteobacteria bacterium]|nr:hypothetical protein [Pseudomonadota bacterium]
MRTVVALAMVATILCFVTVSCGPTQEQIKQAMDSWLGVDKNSLIAQNGPPSQVLNDGQGGEIFVYTNTTAQTSPGMFYGGMYYPG